MASVWMVGLEEEPTRCGEICVFEVFGDALEPGRGYRNRHQTHPRPALTWEFDAPRMVIDVAEPHVYAAEWRPGRVDFFVDGEHVKTVYQAPDYPLQMIVAVFDFPGERPGRRITCRCWPSTMCAAPRCRPDRPPVSFPVARVPRPTPTRRSRRRLEGAKGALAHSGRSDVVPCHGGAAGASSRPGRR